LEGYGLASAPTAFFSKKPHISIKKPRFANRVIINSGQLHRKYRILDIGIGSLARLAKFFRVPWLLRLGGDLIKERIECQPIQ